LHTPDLHTLRKQLDEGATDALTLLDQALAAARSPRCAHAFVTLDEQGARAAAAAPTGALAGLPVSVKDLYDIAGQVTSAGSVVLADRPPATADAPAVARLRAAGAALIGRTQMTEFAFSGVGINPHHGTPANAAMAALDPAAPACVPGGSSSGGAVSVACGAAVAALGSDTGGSIRIPAALHGLVGFKNTQALTPAAGSIPLAPSLDTVCAITRSVRDAVVLHEILAERVVRLDAVPLAARRLAVVRTLMLDALEAPVAAAFERTLAEYNAAARDGLDPAFDRGGTPYNRMQGDASHPGPNPCVAPIEQAPFYAVEILPGSLGTFAGLRTDARARVLSPDRTPIAGLWAVGNDQASVMGGCYPSGGITLGPGMTFGFLAAHDAAGLPVGTPPRPISASLSLYKRSKDLT